MKLHELKPAEGSRKTSKVVGRGIGSGHGKTSGRGHKGQKARSGGGKGPAFQGGQMPLQRAIPKRGFNNIFKKEYTEVNVEKLSDFAAGTVITPELLKEKAIIKKIAKDGVKILGRGEINQPLTVQAQVFTKSAAEKIEAAGGKTEVI